MKLLVTGSAGHLGEGLMRVLRAAGRDAVGLDIKPSSRRGWRMLDTVDRVYDNARARVDLGRTPRHDFRSVLARLRRGEGPRSDLARAIGSKGYHQVAYSDPPYPVGEH